MLDQLLSWIFSDWIMFPILVIALLALSEFGWRVGLARSRAKPEAKDGGSARSGIESAGVVIGFHLCHGD